MDAAIVRRGPKTVAARGGNAGQCATDSNRADDIGTDRRVGVPPFSHPDEFASTTRPVENSCPNSPSAELAGPDHSAELESKNLQLRHVVMLVSAPSEPAGACVFVISA